MTPKDAKRIFSRIPTLHTPRLTLRAMRVTDCDDMFEYAHRADVTRFLTWSPHPSREYTKDYLDYIGKCYRSGEFFDWALIWHGDCAQKMVGTCGFTRFDYDNNSAEVGYVINPTYRGMGIAPEALRRVIEFGFCELELNRIEARYIVGNEVSRRVMEKVGMRFEGVRRQSLLNKERYVDVGYCSILASEYANFR